MEGDVDFARHLDGEPDAPLSPTEPLFVPHRKRLTHSYVINDEGTRELRLDYGLKEVTFDEAHLFAFGERLMNETLFTGERATTWGPGYSWDELQPVLEVLVAEGILQRGEAASDPRGGGLVPSPLPPSVCPVPRAWSFDDCEAITRELGGRAVELGHLEAFIPLFRVAHIALDADDRQVGEGNVFPPQLRLDRDTEWRVCQYAGSRFRDEMPMNVTALKAMIKHWKPMMATIVEVRGHLGARLAISGTPWTIGDLHTLACVVLALPAYQLMKRGDAARRPLHPVLSSLFRITDGIRMTTSEMLLSIERTRQAHEPLTAAELYTRTEQEALFIGRTGVCAGPKHLVDEFLAMAVDGRPAEGTGELELPAEIGALLSELPAVVDYGLCGLQIWALAMSVWLAMSRAYEVLLDVLGPTAAGHAAAEGGSARLHARLRAEWRALENQQLALAYDRTVHANMYADAYERAWRALAAPVGESSLARQLAVRPAGPAHHAAAAQLRGMLAARSTRGEIAGAEVAIERLVEVLVGLAREEQVILTSITAILDAINTALDRPRPKRSLGGRDLHLSNTLTPRVDPFPYLFDTIEQELGIRIDCTASTLEVVEISPPARPATPGSPTRLGGHAARQ